MKNQKLIQAIKEFQLDLNNIPVEVLVAFRELKLKLNQLNKIDNPIFTENDIPINMNNWEEWKYTGLNAIEYITSGFYKNTEEESW